MDAEQSEWALQHVERDACDLRNVFPYLSRGRYVPGAGPLHKTPHAFVVAGAPGAAEAAKGRPFQGPKGVITRRLLESVFLSVDDCWLTYVIKFKLPRNRFPNTTEIKAFRLILQREWLAVREPALIITLGSAAFRSVLSKGDLPKPGTPQYLRNGRVVYPLSDPYVGMAGDDADKEKIEEQWDKLKYWRIAWLNTQAPG